MALSVAVVSAERQVWSGQVDTVVATTTEGEMGVLAGHAPTFAQLADGGVVRLLGGDGGGETRVAAHGGFLSVTPDGVSVLAETAELGEDVDVSRAREALSRAESGDGDDPDVAAARHRAAARLRAAEGG